MSPLTALRRRKSHTAPTLTNARKAKFERLEDRNLLAATPIEILAAGSTGEERVELQIDGVTVQSWDNVAGGYYSGQFLTLSYTHPTDVTADRVRVAFTNDGAASNGADRNLRVDGIRVAGEFFESEAASVFSTGTFSAVDGCAPGFKQSEFLACGGYFQYGASSSGNLIEVRAAGNTGEEQLQLQINGATVETWNNVGGSVASRQFQSFFYLHDEPLAANSVRVAFTNDGTTASGGDRNLLVDGITLDGVVYESEATNTLSVGSFVPGGDGAPGFTQSELLARNGFFQYAPADASAVEIRAAGATGQERMELQVDSVTVQGWNNVGGSYSGAQFITYVYQHPAPLSADRVRVAFVNDGTTSTGADRNLRVDGITLDGVVFESEAANTLSTGTWTAANGCAPGFKQSELLQCGGYFQFNAPVGDPGVIGIGATQFVVGEADGIATVTFNRTDGSDGVATVDYTTVPATATPGQDYVSQSGTITFADGQTQRSIDITILNDGLGEGTETFNVAIDRVTGATAGQPRTTTVSIIDDEQPSTGDGNGLLGEYFAGATFNDLLLRRTDLNVNFNWGSGSPASTVPSNNFAVRWTGQIEPLYSQTYTFLTTTDDGVRLWVNDVLIIDQFIAQAATTHTGQITLTAGVKYDIRMEYNEIGGQASAVLEWSSASQARSVVPTSQLFSEPVTPSSGTFSGETIVSGLSSPTAIEFAPTGQMFIAQKNGVVRVFENGQLVPGSFIDLRAEVNNIQDRGLLGLEIDPNFPAEPYVYLLYTYDPPETIGRTGLAGPDGAGNRVSRLIRVTADANNGYRTVVPGSEVILLGENSVWGNISNPNQDGTNNVNLPPSCQGVNDCIPVDSRSHSIGALAFGTDGSLFITNGDGTSFGRVDPRTVRVQDLDNLAGKVLRIDPDTGLGLSDNPFYQSSNPDSNRSKVYSYGLRNPFRMAINPADGEPYVSDVGWNTWEEINAGRGQNFGWPFYEGGDGQNLQTGGYRDLPEAAAFYANNNATPPLYSRSHANGGVAMVIGDFYTGQIYPQEFQGAVFFTDFGDPTIRALRLDGDGTVAQQLVVSGSVGAVVEMTMGPDGTMYYVDLNGGRVGRFRFEATASAVSAPLVASFTGLGATSVIASPASELIEQPASTPVENDTLLYAALADSPTPETATPLDDDVVPYEETTEANDLPALDEAFGDNFFENDAA
ncbi:MAG: carbohydrate-binding domain-containing protein [Planctomycetota bacterium]